MGSLSRIAAASAAIVFPVSVFAAFSSSPTERIALLPVVASFPDLCKCWVEEDDMVLSSQNLPTGTTLNDMALWCEATGNVVISWNYPVTRSHEHADCDENCKAIESPECQYVLTVTLNWGTAVECDLDSFGYKGPGDTGNCQTTTFDTSVQIDLGDSVVCQESAPSDTQSTFFSIWEGGSSCSDEQITFTATWVCSKCKREAN